jgi:D-alanyl-D-alanine carboxypeptidase
VNTNKLLNRGFVGIKTGVTLPAGPCLATHLRKKRRSYIVVLLNSRSLEQRWVDTMKVVDYCQMKIRYGMMDDIRPPKIVQKVENAEKKEDLDISQADISLSHLNSTCLDQKQTSTTFFKNSDATTGVSEEDGSTTLSSSSPIRSHRKSLY